MGGAEANRPSGAVAATIGSRATVPRQAEQPPKGGRSQAGYSEPHPPSATPARGRPPAAAVGGAEAKPRLTYVTDQDKLHT